MYTENYRDITATFVSQLIHLSTHPCLFAQSIMLLTARDKS